MVALPVAGAREIIMRKSIFAGAVAVLAVSLASFVMLPSSPGAPDAPLGSISTHELTLAAPALTAGPAADAF
jgi:hypothetical protein